MLFFNGRIHKTARLNRFQHTYILLVTQIIKSVGKLITSSKVNIFKQTLIIYGIAAFYGALGGLVTILMVSLLHFTSVFLWENLLHNSITDPSRTLFIPIVLLLTGLLIGFILRRNPTPIPNFENVLADVFTKGEINWKDFPRVLLTGILSITSGASLGPEAPAAYTSAAAASAYASLTKQPVQKAQLMNVGSTSGMIGSLLNSPFLMPILILSSLANNVTLLRSLLTPGLVGSTFGIAAYFVLFQVVPVFNLGLPPYTVKDTFSDLVFAFGTGFIAAVIAAIVLKISNRICTTLLAHFQDRLMTRVMITAVIFSIIAYFFPLVMFSGQYTIPYVVSSATHLSIIFLFTLAILKFFSIVLLLKGGFYGGPIFPSLFAGTALGLAFVGMFGLSTNLAVTAALAGVITIMLRSPFAGALLAIAVVGSQSVVISAIGASGASLLLVAAKKH